MTSNYNRDPQFIIEDEMKEVESLKASGERRLKAEIERGQEVEIRLQSLYKELGATNLEELNDKLEQLGGWFPTANDEEEIKEIFGQKRKITKVSKFGNVELEPPYMTNRRRSAKVNILSPEFDFLEN